VKRFFAAILIAPIRLYQRFISPAFAPRCRYYPTCSEYAVQSLRELGPVRGPILAAWRLLRCNPFSPGGVDEVSDRRLFRGTRTRSERNAKRQRPTSSVTTNGVAGSTRPHLPPGGSSRANLT
jgi:putative membrane protein insertion efficiency factor